jgi:hypothetical protein
MRLLVPFAVVLAVGCGSSEDQAPSPTGGSGGKGGTTGSGGSSGSGAATGGKSSGGGSGKGGSSGKGSGGAGGTAAAGGAGGKGGGGGTGGSATGGSGATGGDSATGGDAGAGGNAGAGGGAPAVCEGLEPVDTRVADHVVGAGTPESCTAYALQSAASEGGIITFDCGPDPVTIGVLATITFTKETIVDGGGLVTLNGAGSARIFYLDSGYDQTTPRLTVQRLAFRQGKSQDTGEDTASGGGAIYRDGGSLTVIDCDFEDNHAPATGQDLAGGAIYGFGGGETVISGSTFVGNSASDGGAVGSLNGDLTIINSVFTDNAATGDGGNPGDGGAGGAIYMDGGDEAANLCGVVIRSNTAGAIAGGFFRVSNSHDGTFTMDKSTVDGNQVTPTDDGNAGGLYLEGLDVSITASTISRNEAFYNGGLWLSYDTVALRNVTIAENTAFGSNGAGLWLGHDPTGTIESSTIANNHSTADGQVAGAMFGSGLALKNTIIAGNTAQYTPGCDAKHDSAGGNLQWPDGALCSSAPKVADPLLGELEDNGGPTETMLPGAGSPAIGLGADCTGTDQRGEPRGKTCTAGAVEVP